MGNKPWEGHWQADLCNAVTNGPFPDGMVTVKRDHVWRLLRESHSLERELAEAKAEVERLSKRLSYYEQGTMRIRCYGCGRSVSTEVPDSTLVRAVCWCPDCTKVGRDQDPDALKAARAEGAREMRELAAKEADALCNYHDPVRCTMEDLALGECAGCTIAAAIRALEPE